MPYYARPAGGNVSKAKFGDDTALVPEFVFNYDIIVHFIHCFDIDNDTMFHISVHIIPLNYDIIMINCTMVSWFIL